MSALERVGFLGLGTMGAFMAANLLAAEHDVTVWNRTPSKADALVAAGATTADTPADVAARVTVLFLCVTDSPDVDAVLFGPNGAADALAEGSLVVDCSTISPTRAQAIARQLAERGVAFIDAPVSGGSEGARLATLSFMIGGDDSDVARAMPYLEAMGKTFTHVGAVGAGQWTKAINQVVLAGTYLGVAEGMALGVRAGLDMSRVVAALRGGAANSWVLENRSERMIDNEYPLGFKASLHRKDLGIALELANELDAELPVSELAAQFEDELIAQGYGGEDMSALARSIRQRMR